MLRATTEPLPELGFPFDRDLPRHAQNRAGELREVRNRCARNEPFTAAEAYRAAVVIFRRDRGPIVRRPA
ncbi:Swt1 family HEPN domain-containing protein [Mycobacterium sp. THU-M104]|uniref:Swt1 family HEPN domain-containing protein n=1 Tax=Mycobacterium sp. THU-M104 TaxID=3410515 RepID=UPI003B993135